MKNAVLDKQVKSYIIENIDFSGYDTKEPHDISDKIAQLKTVFMSEYGWMVERVGMQQALIEWLKGLPSVVTIEFTNYGILQLAKSWGSLPENPTERQENKILDNYWNLIAAKMLQLFSANPKTLIKKFGESS